VAWAGDRIPQSSADASRRRSAHRYRSEGPDGSLYISDDRGGRIWRVLFVGHRDGVDDDEDDRGDDGRGRPGG
jgi:hypothetical protein